MALKTTGVPEHAPLPLSTSILTSGKEFIVIVISGLPIISPSTPLISVMLKSVYVKLPAVVVS